MLPCDPEHRAKHRARRARASARYHRCRSFVRPDPEYRALDDPKKTPPAPRPGGARKPPPSLRAQIGATRDALRGLVLAHIDLAKAELSAVAGEIARVALLAAIAIVVMVLAALLAILGTSLFLAEWLLGSMGWGVLHGVLAFIGIAAAATLLAVGVPIERVGRALLVAVVVGLLAGVTLGLDLPNRLYAAVGESVGLAVDPAFRPLVVGLIVGGLVGFMLGIGAAVSMTAYGAGRFVALAGLIVAGTVLGAFSAITHGPQVGAALGIAVGWLTWIAVMGVELARAGIDVETLRTRFYPTQTIETSKETVEWLKKRMPPGIGS